MKLHPTSEIIVHPALDHTERLVDGRLKEIDPDVTGTELERDPESGGRSLGVPVTRSAPCTREKHAHILEQGRGRGQLTSSACLP